MDTLRHMVSIMAWLTTISCSFKVVSTLVVMNTLAYEERKGKLKVIRNAVIVLVISLFVATGGALKLIEYYFK